MKYPYSDAVMEHFRHPRNVGKMDDADGKAIEGSPACGDMVAVYVKVDPESQKITDAKFESYGCASNIATGSMITELAKGKTLEEAKNITWTQAAEALGGLPKIKAHCSVLAVEGLRSAIENYEERHGLVTEKTPTTIEVIRRRLRKVMNPLTGLDIIRTEMIKDITINEGAISLTVDLPANHQFAVAIKEEIMEKLETLWDVKKVEINFTE
ncbi:MAG: iron-sulfur cluster assembly scaffold protein [Dehalococcoidales bacterium]|nr:iron-sulfur cluster assembly scaffold protein [Dehalococcoidales bacterium]